jgi:hypothetical protein
MEGKISINLAKNKRFDAARESLGDLLDKCIEITGALDIIASERERRREALWLARWAIRAVAEEILRTGKMPLPLKVRLRNDRTENEDDDRVDFWKRTGFLRN